MKQHMNRIDGIHAIAIHDKEGIPIIKVCRESCPERAINPRFLSIFSLVSEQVSKMNFGQNKKIVSFYDSYQVVQCRQDPVVVTVIADVDANTGLMMELDIDMAVLLNELKPVVRPVSWAPSYLSNVSASSNGYGLTAMVGWIPSVERHHFLTLVFFLTQWWMGWTALMVGGKNVLFIPMFRLVIDTLLRTKLPIIIVCFININIWYVK